MNEIEKYHKSTFFNKIGMADMERVHSAVIGWMLSDECMAFDIAVRSNILNNLFFGSDTDKVYTKIESHIEWEDIDILFETEDSQGNKDCWVVENKIKTSQHSNQLKKYEGIINEDYPNSNKHFAYLTLIGETANKNDQWINITYHKLVQLLFESLKDLQNSTDAVILKEYYYTIQQLDNAVQEFIKNPGNYPNVFTDGCKSNKMKQYGTSELSELSRFIGMNNLETIFQKMYFTKVLDEVLDECSVPYEKWHVGETRGNADFAIHFDNYPNPKEKDDFHFDMSFQAGTFKFAISRSYWDKGTSLEYIDSVRTWQVDFVELQKVFPEYNRFNNVKSRARISISKNLKKECKWYQMDRKTFVEMIMKEFETAYKMRQYVIDIHEKRGATTNSL